MVDKWRPVLGRGGRLLGFEHPALLRLDATRALAAGSAVAAIARLGGLRGGRAVTVGSAVAAVLTPVLYVRSAVEVIADLVQESIDSQAGLFSLAGLFADDDGLRPSFGGFAMHPESAAALADQARALQPASVLELGPGTSSVVLTRVAAPQRMVGLEHEAGFVDELVDRLARHGLDDYDLRYAPLVDTMIGTWHGRWYDPKVVDGLDGPFDLIVVDGPPGHGGRHARMPALPRLSHLLGPSGHVFLDDVHREDEQAVLSAWLDRADTTLVARGRRWALLQVRADAGPVAD